MDRKAFYCTVLAGVLLWLSFPKYNYNFLIWIALVPLLYAIEGKSILQAFYTGIVAGIVFNTGLIYWITFVVVHYGNLPAYIGIAVMLLLAAYLSLYTGLVCGGIIFFQNRGIELIVSAPLLWTCLEYCKSVFFTGFPWENLGYSLCEHTFLIQIADITGVYGLTFLIVFVNCLVYHILRAPMKKKTFFYAAVGIVFLISSYSYGFYRKGVVNKAIDTMQATAISLSLIQGNIDQSVKWNARYQDSTLKTYKNLSMKSLGNGSDVIIWPETAVPFYFQNIDDRHREIIEIARVTKSNLIIGAPAYEKAEGGYRYYNRAYVVDSEGAITKKYDKVHLVPFGEYVPLQKILYFASKLVEGAGNFTPGLEFAPIEIEGNKAGILICYEGIFPEISRDYCKKGAEFLINLTNDAWYGKTSAPYQHLSMLTLRAVENRVYIARAANTGISAIINPFGTPFKRTGLFEADILNGDIIPLKIATIYKKYGDIFVYGCFLILAILILVLEKERLYVRRYS